MIECFASTADGMKLLHLMRSAIFEVVGIDTGVVPADCGGSLFTVSRYFQSGDDLVACENHLEQFIGRHFPVGRISRKEKN